MEKILRIIKIALMAGMLFALVLLAITLTDRAPGFGEDGNLEKINFHGTYQTSEMKEPKTYSEGTEINGKDCKYVEFVGYFDKDIAKDVSVMMRSYYTRGRLFVNGKEEDVFGQEDSYPAYMNSAGKGWVILKCPNLTTEDQLRIIISADYEKGKKYAYNDFIENIYFGNSNELFQETLKTNWYLLVLGVIIVLIGTMIILINFLVKKLKIASQKYLLWLSIFMICGGIWVFLNFDALTFIVSKGYKLSMLEFVIQNFMMISLLLYIEHFVTEKKKIIVYIPLCFDLILIMVYLVTQTTGFMDGYQLNDYFAAIVVIAVAAIGLSLGLTQLKKRTNERYYIILSVIPLAIGALADTFNYYLDYSRVNLGMTIGLVVFVIINGAKALLEIQKSYEKASAISKLETRLMEDSVNTMLSQIQPHFMFNCLTAIQQLCLLDPDKAEEAVGDFAAFLRVNVSTLKNTDLIPFNKELIHIKHYINLEKIRFEERVKVEYDLEVTDFLLPSLSVQPIVENAVRHGITKKMEGGTVKISTFMKKDNVVIIVKDDGIGMERSALSNLGTTATGVESIKQRLASLCNGKLEVESILGVGTVVTITIPLLS